MMEENTVYYFRKYIEDDTYPVSDEQMERINEIIKFIKTRNELRTSFAKRMNVSLTSLSRMTNFYHSHRRI